MQISTTPDRLTITATGLRNLTIGLAILGFLALQWWQMPGGACDRGLCCGRGGGRADHALRPWPVSAGGGSHHQPFDHKPQDPVWRRQPDSAPGHPCRGRGHVAAVQRVKPELPLRGGADKWRALAPGPRLRGRHPGPCCCGCDQCLGWGGACAQGLTLCRPRRIAPQFPEACRFRSLWRKARDRHPSARLRPRVPFRFARWFRRPISGQTQ